MRALNVLLALLVSAAIGIAVLEGGLRLIPAFRPPPTLNRFDPATGWSQIPGARAVRRVAGRAIDFEINALGLRDEADMSLAKPAGKRRALVLGDSFALGYTVAREECFADLLERRWAGEGRGIEVVNAGTEGWSTDQQAAWFLARGADFAPDVVLLFPYENDLYWCGQTSYQRFPKPRFTPEGQLEPRALADPGTRGFLGRSAIASFLGKTLGALLSRPSERTHERLATDSSGGHAWVPKEFTPLLLQPPDYVADCEARAGGALRALKARCDALGARLVVIPVPSKSAIDPVEREFFRTWERGLGGLTDSAWSPDRPVERFLELARALAIDTVDPRAALRAAAGAHFGQMELHLRSALRAASEDPSLYHEPKVEQHLIAALDAVAVRDLQQIKRHLTAAQRATSARTRSDFEAHIERDVEAALRIASSDHRLYFEKKVEWHLTAAGNRALAAIVHDELDALGAIVPASAQVVPEDLFEVAGADRRPLWPFVFAGLWAVLSALYLGTYRDENKLLAALKVGALLAAIFTIVLGGQWLIGFLPHWLAPYLLVGFVAAVLAFVAWKLGRRLGTVAELLRAFVLRGHWYLMPLIVVLVTVGSLLVVAASSPLVAPFIYTLF